MVAPSTHEPYFPEPLIRQAANSIIGRYRLTRSDLPDIEQYIRLRIVQGWVRYDPKIAQANTFADRLVWAALATFIRDHTRGKRDPRRVDGSLDSCSNEPSTTRHDHAHEVLRLDTKLALEQLEPDDLRYAEAIKDYGPYQAAKRVGLTRRKAESALRRIRSVFEAAGMRCYVQSDAERN
jgi:hypothetical protein